MAMKLSKEIVFEAAVKIATAYVGTIHTQEDYDRIKTNAKNNKFNGVSDYIAVQSVNQVLQIEAVIDENRGA